MEMQRLANQLGQKEESVRVIQIANEQYKSKCAMLESELNQKTIDLEQLGARL